MKHYVRCVVFPCSRPPQGQYYAYPALNITGYFVISFFFFSLCHVVSWSLFIYFCIGRWKKLWYNLVILSWPFCHLHRVDNFPPGQLSLTLSTSHYSTNPPNFLPLLSTFPPLYFPPARKQSRWQISRWLIPNYIYLRHGSLHACHFTPLPTCSRTPSLRPLP